MPPPIKINYKKRSRPSDNEERASSSTPITSDANEQTSATRIPNRASSQPTSNTTNGQTSQRYAAPRPTLPLPKINYKKRPRLSDNTGRSSSSTPITSGVKEPTSVNRKSNTASSLLVSNNINVQTSHRNAASRPSLPPPKINYKKRPRLSDDAGRSNSITPITSGANDPTPINTTSNTASSLPVPNTTNGQSLQRYAALRSTLPPPIVTYTDDSQNQAELAAAKPAAIDTLEPLRLIGRNLFEHFNTSISSSQFHEPLKSAQVRFIYENRHSISEVKTDEQKSKIGRELKEIHDKEFPPPKKIPYAELVRLHETMKEYNQTLDVLILQHELQEAKKTGAIHLEVEPGLDFTDPPGLGKYPLGYRNSDVKAQNGAFDLTKGQRGNNDATVNVQRQKLETILDGFYPENSMYNAVRYKLLKDVGKKVYHHTIETEDIKQQQEMENEYNNSTKTAYDSEIIKHGRPSLIKPDDAIKAAHMMLSFEETHKQIEIKSSPGKWQRTLQQTKYLRDEIITLSTNEKYHSVKERIANPTSNNSYEKYLNSAYVAPYEVSEATSLQALFDHIERRVEPYHTGYNWKNLAKKELPRQVNKQGQLITAHFNKEISPSKFYEPQKDAVARFIFDNRQEIIRIRTPQEKAKLRQDLDKIQIKELRIPGEMPFKDIKRIYELTTKYKKQRLSFKSPQVNRPPIGYRSFDVNTNNDPDNLQKWEVNKINKRDGYRIEINSILDKTYPPNSMYNSVRSTILDHIAQNGFYLVQRTDPKDQEKASWQTHYIAKDALLKDTFSHGQRNIMEADSAIKAARLMIAYERSNNNYKQNNPNKKAAETLSFPNAEKGDGEAIVRFARSDPSFIPDTSRVFYGSDEGAKVKEFRIDIRKQINAAIPDQPLNKEIRRTTLKIADENRDLILSANTKSDKIEAAKVWSSSLGGWAEKVTHETMHNLATMIKGHHQAMVEYAATYPALLMQEVHGFSEKQSPSKDNPIEQSSREVLASTPRDRGNDGSSR